MNIMKLKHILSALAFSGVTATAAGQAGHADKLPQAAGKAPAVLSTAEFGAKDGPLSDDSAAEAAALEQATAARSLLRSQWMYKAPKRGIKAWKSTFGTRDQATVASFSDGDEAREARTEVLGLAADSDVSVHPERDHVALFVQQLAQPAAVATSKTTYTATSVTSPDFAAAIAAGKIKRGMMIDTGERPKKTGVIYSASGSTINVSAWYVVDGKRATATPARGTPAYVNPSTKVWALNANVEVRANSMATDAVGFELGLVNDKADDLGYLYDAVNLGSKRGLNAFQSRGRWVQGFYAYNGTNYGFVSQTAAQIGFYAQGGPVGMQSDGATAIAYLAKNAANALVVQNTAGKSLTILDGAGVWQSIRTRYATFANGQTIDGQAVVASALVVSAATTIHLPAPGANASRVLYVKNPKGSTVPVDFAGNVEDASGSVQVAPGGAVTLISDGSKWIPIGKY
jgi:hypothetical protein